jgi:iron-sulfur cluster repair protein YtfE (RIC family)
MDIYELIKNDHRRLLDVLDSIEATPEANAEQRKRLFSYFRTELMVHAKPEEEIFYGELRRSDLGRHLVQEAMDEHHTLERLVMDIQTSSAKDDDWIGKLRTLRQVLETHMQKEESEYFTLGKQLFQAQDAEDIADRMLAEKGRYGMENPVAVVGKKIKEVLG